MNKYKKLTIPSWNKKGWEKYINQNIRYFIYSIKNIIRWIPTLYRDRDWDDYYILKILQKKIEHQRKYLVDHNRYVGVDLDNFWMTVVLNLIEKNLNSYYEMEYMDYEETSSEFTPSKTHNGCFEWNQIILFENYDLFLSKYKSAARKILKNNPELSQDKSRLCREISYYNHQRSFELIYDIMKLKSRKWWD